METTDPIVAMDRSPRTEEPLSMRHILRILFRHKRKSFLVFLFISVAVTAVTLSLPEIYEARAKLLIKVGRENLSVDPGVVGPTVSLVQSRESDINSEIAILKSRLVYEQVVDGIGPDRFFPDRPGETPITMVKMALAKWDNPLFSFFQSFLDRKETEDDGSSLREKAIEDLDRHLSVFNERDSHILTLNYQHQDPKLAKEVLDRLLASYLAHHIAVHGTQTSSKFFDEKSQEILKQLNDKESAYRDFCTSRGIASLDRQKDLLLTQISDLRTAVHDADTRISASRAKIAYLKQNIERSPSTMVLSQVTGKANPAADEIKTRLIDLKLKEADLAGKYPDDFRLLQDVRKQIKLTESALLEEEQKNTEVTTGVNTNYMTLQLDLEREKAAFQEFTAQRNTLAADLSVLEKNLTDLIGNETTITHLKREMDILQTKYRNYREKYQQAFTSEALDMDNVSNVSVVQSSAVSFDPVKPKKMLPIGLGLLLGLFTGLALAFVWEYFDDTLKTREDVEKHLGLPVLAAVSDREFKRCI